jgi:predicted Zn-dependent protease with MMP-like domain
MLRRGYRVGVDPAPSTQEPVDFDSVIDDAIDDLPLAFAEQLGSVAIVIEDEPTPDQLASVNAFGLYGLYQGVPRTRWGADGVPFVSKITLFRGPLTRANRDPERLRQAIRETLHHEIAHHFGIDDARLRELQRE